MPGLCHFTALDEENVSSRRSWPPPPPFLAAAADRGGRRCAGPIAAPPRPSRRNTNKIVFKTMTFLFFKYDFFYQFIHLFIYLLIYLFIYIFIYLLIYLFIHYFLITIFPDQLVKRDQPRSPWTLGQGPSRSHALTASPHRSLWASLVGVSLGHRCLGTV